MSRSIKRRSSGVGRFWWRKTGDKLKLYQNEPPPSKRANWCGDVLVLSNGTFQVDPPLYLTAYFLKSPAKRPQPTLELAQAALLELVKESQVDVSLGHFDIFDVTLVPR